ncbi:unnamed protein product [Protopolystoma xenopodis]|uniref:Uncharacterized protein n=1 Tax=Protopolystoma xenopodis TaxID=117903 RepID=A0A3S5A0U3_9PLAT|nr:unnamed protein product [Protopolystoma xenopodis]
MQLRDGKLSAFLVESLKSENRMRNQFNRTQQQQSSYPSSPSYSSVPISGTCDKAIKVNTEPTEVTILRSDSGSSGRLTQV